MLTYDNFILLNEYLEENKQRNQTVDKARTSRLQKGRQQQQKQKVEASFDPLLDQEPDCNTDRPTDEDSSGVLFVCHRTVGNNNSKSPDSRNKPPTSETSTAALAKGKGKKAR